MKSHQPVIYFGTKGDQTSIYQTNTSFSGHETASAPVFLNNPPVFFIPKNLITFAALKSSACIGVLVVAAIYLAYHESKIIISRLPNTSGKKFPPSNEGASST